MLADVPSRGRSGSLRSDVHLRHEQLYELLAFIASQLPPWRDHADRPAESSERRLTDQLCDHLTSAARMSPVWDILQFRTEIPVERSRSIDLSANPCATTVFIDGRRHTQFDMLLPIECKRLPTPDDPKRDEREYVISQDASTGGIHRFKLGAHGKSHVLAGMIAYIQAETVSVWRKRITGWITDLAKTDASWSAAECLADVEVDRRRGLAALRSSHRRVQGLPDIEIRHLWIVMKRAVHP